jgi:hypothetical protein
VIRSTITLLPILLLAAGCGSGKANSTAGGPSPWEKAKHGYTIVGVSRSDVPRISEQKRTTQLIVPAASSQAEVLIAVREAYAALTHEIQEAQADAKYRSVAITVYDTKQDLELDPKAWLCQIRLSPDKGQGFPKDIDSQLTWQWRDPAQAPAEQDRKIEWDYLKELAAVDADAPFGVTDAEQSGLNGVQRRAFIEERYSDDAAAIREDLAARYKLDAPQIKAALDRVLQWKYPAAAAGK